MKLSNKQILKIFEHCINPLRNKLTKQNYKQEIVEPLSKIDNLDITFEAHTGISKLCLIPLDSDCNFVIKIPFTGNQASTDTYFPFINVTNYCDEEVSNCKFLIRHGYGNLIAKIAFIGKVGDLYIYKQEKVTTIAEEKCYKDIDDNLLYEAEDIAGDYECLDPYWTMDLIDYLGKGAAIDFLNFLYEEGLDDDLHGANVGFLGDTPVILDYSCYLDDIY